MAGRYRLEERLGRGGMGTVWRATDELLGRPVAVKELHMGEGDQAGGVAAGALREARAVAHVRHPHVVVVHDVIEHDGRPCIIMELVDGGSLADLIGAGKTLTPVETARTGLALLGALTAAHGRGVLHRDVKPANVLMEAATGRVVLTDFGIARLSGATTISETGAFVGSPEYTAPERMQGAEAGPASDLWSLGTLMCAALTGESPFRRDSLGGILHAVVSGEIRPPAQAGPLLPVIRGLLERDPERRMTAPEAERLLSAYLTGGSLAPADRIPVSGGASVAGPVAGYASGPEPVPGSEGLTAPAQPPRPTARQLVANRPGLHAGLIAAALVLVASGAVAGASLLGDEDSARGPAPGAAAGAPRTSVPSGPSGASGTTASAAPSAGPAGASPGAPGAPSAPVTPVTAVTTPGALPAGYRTVADPQGFGIAVPEGYQRATDDQRVFYVSPDGAFRIGIRVKMPVPGGPLGVMRQAHAKGPDTNPGYRVGTVVSTSRHEHPAALWEFTWNGFTPAEGARHTYDLCWDENGRMYDIWVSAPVGKLAEAKRHFDTAVATFVPGAPGTVTP
ncbi:serine/threonine-protein kinase [Streptomyces sp. ISL-66]|uniref:serine/threonine-protein kinase n=1 Tax=Streptomyces sp. ISL-66 TaxID=2819186 RepID=UPI002034D51A|nr:serine/threonine-protein kinase [Streptomyces sp. ISL-66]